MKVLFIYPEIRRDIPNFGGYYHEGIAILSAALKQAGHSTELLHLTRRLQVHEFAEELRNRAFDLVAFSSLTPLYPEVRRLAPVVKNVRPDTPVIYGGVHTTVDPERAIETDGIDEICLGEAEEAIVELVDRLSSGGDPTTVRNFWAKTPRGIVRNLVRPLVENLDSLPKPDLGLFDFDRLFSTRERMVMLTASRGCPFHCSYCSNPAQQKIYPNRQAYVRFKSVGRVIDEAKMRIEGYPHHHIRYLDFSDDILPLRKDWFAEFAERFPKEVGKPFQCNGLFSLLDEERVEQLRHAGCAMVVFGLETGSDRIRELMSRPKMTNAMILEAGRLLRRAQINVGTYNMIGLPTEKLEEMLQTVKVNASLRPSKMNVFFFQPYPHTELYDLCVKEGLFQEGVDLYNNWRVSPILKNQPVPHAQAIFIHRFFKILVKVYRAGRWLTPTFDLRFDRFLMRVLLPRLRLVSFLARSYHLAYTSMSTVYAYVVVRFWTRRTHEMSTRRGNRVASAIDGLRRIVRRLNRTVMLAGRHGASFARHATPRKIVNLARVHLAMSSKNTRLKAYPYEMIVDPNNICNLHCPLCVTGQRLNTRPFGEMPLERFRRLLDEMSPYLFKIRLYSWGEPLLHRNVYDMIAYASRKNVSTELSTNLHPFSATDGDADRMIASGLERLIVSLDGTTPETYRQYRVGGDFQKVMRNIRTIAERKREARTRAPEIELQFIVMRHNEHEVNEIARFTREVGADQFRLVNVILNIQDRAQRERWLPSWSVLSRYDYRNYEDKVFSSQKLCPWPWRSAVVNWDGTVSPCCIFEGTRTDLGNIDEAGFAAVWNGEKYRAARDVLVVGRGSSSAPDGVSSSNAARPLCAICRGRPLARSKDQTGLF